MKGKISEIFFSIQGEGPFVGTPCHFVRFFGCNEKCSYCDTKYALSGQFSLMTVSQVAERVKSHFPIVITGGEPTIQGDFLSGLVEKLRGRRIFLETNGAKSIKNIVRKFDFISFHLIPPFSRRKKRFIEEISAVNFCVKVVVERKTEFREVFKVADFLKKFRKGVLILQPMSSGKRIFKWSSVKCLKFAKRIYPAFSRVLVVPQIHKALDFR